MMPNEPVRSPSVSAGSRAEALALLGEFKQLWRHGCPIEAPVFLEAHPELAATRSFVLDLAYEEYCLLAEQGQCPDLDEFCRRFPDHQDSLRGVLNTHRLLEADSDLLRHCPELADEPGAWPAVGEDFLGFTLRRELGRGAFARVFLAHEPALGSRPVAVKIALHGAVEAETLGRIDHPNIVPVHSVHRDPHTGLSLVCMPYLGSATLADVLDRVRRSAVAPDAARIILEAASGAGADEIARAEEPPADVLRMGSYVEGILHLALQLADALAFIHERGILHRDLKPSNVLLSPSGRPMLLDFNLAADSQRMGARFGGTLPYMAPEQLRALDPQATEQRDAVDARADLFALGVIVYELLAREHPFGPWPAALSSAELGRLLRDRQRHPPRRLSLAHRGVDVRLALLVERCLAFDPAQRPQSALELAAQLRQLLAQRRKRWRARAALTLATAAVLLLAGVVFLPRYPTRPAAPDWLTRGQEYCQHGEYERGVECFNRVLERDPDLEAAWFHRGRAYQKLGEFILALESYRRAYQLAPQGRLSALMGYCDSQVQQHYAAISHYERAIAEGFATAEVYNNRGCSSLQVSLHDKAQESLDAALQLDPQLQAACYNRALLDYARALKTAGHVPRRGIEDIETAIRVGPVTAAHHRDAARLHAVAARQDPNQKPFALRHARIAVDLGQDPSALAADRALLSLFCEPEFKELVRQSRKNPPPIKPLRFLDPVPEP